MVTTRDTSGTLCEEAMRAFDRLCALERTRDDAEAMLTPRQAHRRRCSRPVRRPPSGSCRRRSPRPSTR